MYNLTHSWEDDGIYTFPKINSTKVNVIARFEFELSYYDVTALYDTYYTTEIFPK